MSQLLNFFNLLTSLTSDKYLHLRVGIRLVVDKRFTTNDGDAIDLWSHGDGGDEHVADCGTVIEVEVLHFTDVAYGRFCCTCLDGTVTSEGTGTLGNVLYEPRLRHETVVVDEEIVGAHGELACCLIPINAQQLVDHHDRRALWYKFLDVHLM